MISIAIGSVLLIQRFMNGKFDKGMAGMGGDFERQMRTGTLDPKDGYWER